MIKLSKLKTLLLTAVFTAISAQTAFAATYTVKAGDTLYSLGKTYNTSYQTLMSTNSLTSTAIRVGQVLTVPGTNYIVKSGDTLYSIARSHSITVYSIKYTNHLTSDTIFVGQKLIIPTSSSSSVSNSTAQPAGVISYTLSDVNLMARLIKAEAENQTYTSKVAVGAVIVNRVQSSLFPNTISRVINQQSNGVYQFTPVKSGTINNTPSQDDINAAYAALKGADPTNGALFYYDTSSTSTWLKSRTVSYTNGDMIFTY